MKKLMFQKKLILINQTNQKNVCFAITGILTLFRMGEAKSLPLPVFPLYLLQTWELATKTF